MSKHTTHVMHENSIESFEQVEFGQREIDVLWAYKMLGPVTDRMVMKFFDVADPNYVRPAITRLIKKKILRECGTHFDEDTQRSVRLVEPVT